MGERKLPKNVEVHGGSLRVKFFFEGKWRRLSLRIPPEPANIKFAARELARIELEIASGAFDLCRHFPRTVEARRREALARDPTVAEVYTRWMATKSAHRASTLRRYSGAYRLYIAPTFAASTFKTLKLSDLKVWSAQLARRISPYTANKARAVFHDMGTFAVMDGLVGDALAVLRAQRESGTIRNVFESGGKPVSVNSFRDRWTPWLKRAGVPYRNPYTMRHTYASRLISAGLPPAYVAGQLGHSVQVLLSVYARWLPRERPDLERALKIGPPVGHEK